MRIRPPPLTLVKAPDNSVAKNNQIGGKMKKQEIIKIKEELKRSKTITLQNHINTMNEIIHDRAVSKNMWFWTDNGNKYNRRRKENYYHRNEHTAIGKHDLYYYRNIKMSCRHVYVTEELTFDDHRISVADLNKLIDAFEEIINRRNNK